MKLLKMGSLLFLAALLLMSCANIKLLSTPVAAAQPTVDPQRKFHEPDEFKIGNHPPITFYVKHNRWESPFNPHEVLQYWAKVAAQQVAPTVMIAILGNPKVDWKFLRSKKIDPMKVAIPKGEISSAVVFIFVQTPKKTIELFSYGYVDDLGVQNVYVLNLETMVYERKMVPKQQQSCLDNHLKVAFVSDPTY